MKGKLISVVLFFAAVIIAATCFMLYSAENAASENMISEHIIAANEIEQLSLAGNSEEAAEKASELLESLRTVQAASSGIHGVVILCVICLVFLCVVFCYVYFAVLRPFDKFDKFAHSISEGNFDVPLKYERSNYFGAFTWAFDSMRCEITKARNCEKEAIENNKTVIATLSHDIKTPVSSIRAYAEGLDANMDTTPEKRRKYLSVIMRKCDEVSRLTDDLFIHSISDLNMLKIVPEKMEICSFMKEAVKEISADQKDINVKTSQSEIFVNADKKRLMQITENLINNARKYAGTDIDIWIDTNESYAQLHFRDYGNGMPDKDVPFAFDKFYRGKNCGERSGSGLGLYIVKYIAQQHSGSTSLHNHTDGLEVIVSLPMIIDN